MGGLGHTRRLAADADEFAGAVVAAEGHLRPAVVGAGLQPVEQVAAGGAMVDGPQLAAVGVDGQPLLVAMAKGVDLGAQIAGRLVDEGIVGVRAAVLQQANQ